MRRVHRNAIACLYSGDVSRSAAMGLGYEEKTEEIFRQMGLETYQIPFTSDAREWIGKAGHFLANANRIRDQLAKALDERCAAAQEISLQSKNSRARYPPPR